jgi:outer membrane immunogenic protein
MKKIILFSVALLCFNSAFAQLKKGNRLINGTFSAAVGHQEVPAPSNLTAKTSGFSIQPRIGFFTSDKTVLGVGVGYNYTKTRYEYNNSTPNMNRTYTYSVTPFIRRYFSLGDKVAFFLDGRLNVGFGNTIYTNPTYDPNTGVSYPGTFDSNTFTGGLSLKPGVAFFITEKWSVEATFATLGYDYNKVKDSNSKSSNFAANINSLAFGLSYYINK